MSGIAGFNWKDDCIIGSMCDKIRHRGPNGEKYFVDEKVSLGHCIFSPSDVSRESKTLKSNSSETLFIVCDTNIYNGKELQKELIEKGYKIHGQSDAELILSAYEAYGTDCIKKMNGAWAFCIYDKKQNKLFLSRDRFGIKPLYYYYNANKFIFSSEIKPLLCHEIEVKTNDPIIFDFFYFNLVDHTEETFFKGIRRLKASYNMIFDLNTFDLRLEQYYFIKDTIKQDAKSTDCKIKNIEELFYDAVRRASESEVPLGASLSGGIDSSSIVLAMDKLKKHGKIKTFSLKFAEKGIDESIYQQQVIDYAKTDAQSLSLEVTDLLNDVARLILVQEEPFPSTTVYGQYKVAELASKQGMRVLLNGQGSDEIFAGYHYFNAYYYFELFKQLKLFTLFKEIIYSYSKTGSLVAFQSFILRLVPNFLKTKLYTSVKVPYMSTDFIGLYINDRKDVRWNISSLDEALIMSIENLLPKLLRFDDKSTMSFSAEVRVPFLDHRLVECALSTPSKCKIYNGINKYSFRAAMKSTLPESIRCRFDKLGFPTPEEKWFRSVEAQEFVNEIINSESFAKRKYWDAKKVKVMYANMVKGGKKKVFAGTDIWRCVSVEIWLRTFID